MVCLQRELGRIHSRERDRRLCVFFIIDFTVETPAIDHIFEETGQRTCGNAFCSRVNSHTNILERMLGTRATGVSSE